MNKAIRILEAGAQHMRDRAATYDKPEGEHSMPAVVRAFEAVTGVTMTVEQGWLFMALVKAVRSQQGDYKADNYEDGAAYFALAGEQAQIDRGDSDDGWIPVNFGSGEGLPGQLLQVRYGNGHIASGTPESFAWEHVGGLGGIVAYRVVKEAE